MNENKKVMPEALYSLDNGMSLEKLERAQESGSYVIGHVFLWNSVDQLLRVNLGNSIFGSIPLNEISIYPTVRANENLSPEVYSLIGSTICACVHEINGSSIVLSRRKNMLNTFQSFSDSKGEIIDCFVKSPQSSAVYTDIGHGISGRIHVSDLCSSRLHHTSDIGIKKGDVIKVKISDINQSNFFIDLSYKDLFEDLRGTLNIGDFIEAVVLDSINEDGYFSYVNPSTPAIVNIPSSLSISYGTKIVARVKSFNAKGNLKLAFISLI